MYGACLVGESSHAPLDEVVEEAEAARVRMERIGRLVEEAAFGPEEHEAGHDFVQPRQVDPVVSQLRR
jgi:hypothetical protein